MSWNLTKRSTTLSIQHYRVCLAVSGRWKNLFCLIDGSENKDFYTDFCVINQIIFIMAYHYVVTAQKPTAVTACVTGKSSHSRMFDQSEVNSNTIGHLAIFSVPRAAQLIVLNLYKLVKASLWLLLWFSVFKMTHKRPAHQCPLLYLQAIIYTKLDLFCELVYL